MSRIHIFSAVLSLLTAAVLSAVLGACSRGSGEITAADGTVLPASITIDYAAWNILSLVLRDQGYLEEEFRGDGVDINWVYTVSGPRAMEMLSGESADFGSGAAIVGLTSFISGNPIEGIYLVNHSASWILTAPGSSITDVSGLRGASITVPTGTHPHFHLLRMLDEAGIDPGEVSIVPLPPAEGKNELLRGGVDAFIWSQPQVQQAMREGAQVIYCGADAGGESVLYARTAFLERYPEATVRVLAMYEKARRFALEHPEEYLQIIARHTGLQSEEARAVLEYALIDIDPDPTALRAKLLPYRRALAQLGVLGEGDDLQDLSGRYLSDRLIRRLQAGVPAAADEAAAGSRGDAAAAAPGEGRAR